MVVFELLRVRSWSKSSVVRSAGVADFVGSVLGAGLGATYTMLLESGGDSLPCLLRDRAVLKLRVATRLAMMKDSGRDGR